MKKIKISIAVVVIAVAALGSFLLLHSKNTPATQPLKKVEGGTVTKPVSQVTQTSPARSSFDKTKYSLSDPTSIWVVVNKTRPFSPLSYVPADLVAVGGGQQMRSDAAAALKRAITDAKTAGLAIAPLSGYRSYNTQTSVYANEVKTNGQKIADSESARPGYSEHQTGLAVDVGGGGCGIEDCFGATSEGKWIYANAYEYGFILRYPADKVAITGYRNEAWHFRYIGKDLALEMHSEGVETLEEFFGLPAAPDYK